MRALSVEALQTFLDERFGGTLQSGNHASDHRACALEALAAWQGLDWTDSPYKTRTFDLRPINDMKVSEEVRTKYLLPVLVAYAGSLDWPIPRQQAVVT